MIISPIIFKWSNYIDLYKAAEKKQKQNLAKQTKKIHCSFACFHKETKTLVIALIDKEIKVYRIKENGSRITVEPRFSFYVKHTVTYLEIEKYIVNDKIILIAGTEVGKIEIYYIDEKPMFEQQIMRKNL